jgi:hypothetical protein
MGFETIMAIVSTSTTMKVFKKKKKDMMKLKLH